MGSLLFMTTRILTCNMITLYILSPSLKPDQTRMRVDESRNSRSRLTANSHQLSSTLSWFKFWWESMRGLARLTGHESCTRVAEASRDFPFFSLPIRRRRKKENIIMYHRQVTIGVMTRTVSSLTSVKKRRNRKRGSNEQKQGNRKKKKDSRQLSGNSHCSFDRAMTVEETLMQTLACQLSSSFDSGFMA